MLDNAKATKYTLVEFIDIEKSASGILIDTSYDETMYYPRKGKVIVSNEFDKDDILFLHRLTFKNNKSRGTLIEQNKGVVLKDEIVIANKKGNWESYNGWLVVCPIEAEKKEGIIWVEQPKYKEFEAEVVIGNDKFKKGDRIIMMRDFDVPLEDWMCSEFGRELWRVHEKHILAKNNFELVNKKVMIKEVEDKEEGILIVPKDNSQGKGIVVKSNDEDVPEGIMVQFAKMGSTEIMYEGEKHLITEENFILYQL